MKIKLRKYPYPFKAWLTISNDPDHTTYERWEQLHRFIWEELKLPISDSLFVTSYNEHINGQISLKSCGNKILKHKYDTIHTWGDYVNSRKKVFSRKDAVNAANLLQENNIRPLVWVDHSSFSGNFIKNSNKGSLPFLFDAAGYKYENFNYSFDIAYGLGIRYIWDGYLTRSLQVEPEILSYVKSQESFRLKLLKSFCSRVFSVSLTKKDTILDGYVLKKTDISGKVIYVFRRYGTWNDATIDGIPNMINENLLDELLENEGIIILYTHLGKRVVSRENDKVHIPEGTAEAFCLLKDYYEKGLINISPLSELLDYVVLKNNLRIETKNNIIRFLTDGIRYTKLSKNDLSGKAFSFEIANNIRADDIKIYVDSDRYSEYTISKENNNIITLKFN